MYCVYCGASNPDGFRYCRKCGQQAQPSVRKREDYQSNIPVRKNYWDYPYDDSPIMSEETDFVRKFCFEYNKHQNIAFGKHRFSRKKLSTYLMTPAAYINDYYFGDEQYSAADPRYFEALEKVEKEMSDFITQYPIPDDRKQFFAFYSYAVERSMTTKNVLRRAWAQKVYMMKEIADQRYPNNGLV